MGSRPGRWTPPQPPGVGLRRRRGAATGLSLALILGGLLPLASAAVPRLPGAGTPPSVTLTAGPLSGYAPLLVTFIAAVGASGSFTVDWTFGDGGSLSGSGPASESTSHWYYVPGTFDARISVVTPNGTANANATIRVIATPILPSAVATPASGVSPLTVEFRANASGGSGTYTAFLWSFGDGGTGEGISVAYTYLHAGRFSVVLNVTDSQNRSGAQRIWVSVTDPTDGSPNGPSGNGGPSDALGPGEIGVGVAAAVGLGSGVLTFVLLRRRDRWEFPGPQAADPPPGPEGGWTPEVDRVAVEPPAPAASSELSAPALELSVAPEPEPGSAEGPTIDRLEPVAAPGPGYPPAAARRLADRTLTHLYRSGALPDVPVPRSAHTQAGIAEALGSQQNVVSKVLTRLVAAGAVAVSTRHVPGQSRRVKTYYLTATGEAFARELGRPVRGDRSVPGDEASPPSGP